MGGVELQLNALLRNGPQLEEHFQRTAERAHHSVGSLFAASQSKLVPSCQHRHLTV